MESKEPDDLARAARVRALLDKLAEILTAFPEEIGAFYEWIQHQAKKAGEVLADDADPTKENDRDPEEDQA